MSREVSVFRALPLFDVATNNLFSPLRSQISSIRLRKPPPANKINCFSNFSSLQKEIQKIDGELSTATDKY